jgi:hypothetical protein
VMPFNPTLGFEVVEWIDCHWDHPPLSAEQREVILRLFEVFPKGHQREGQFVHPAPIMFDGWDANGNPVAAAPVLQS